VPLHSKVLLYSWIFFLVLRLKGELYKIMFLSTCCGPLYGPAKSAKSEKPVFLYIAIPLVWKIVTFKRVILKFLKLLDNLSLDQN
jgi:hypothetical protein